MKIKNYVLEKSFRFESAHRLAKNYEGKCRNIHGHSWNGKIAISTSNLDNFGFGLDYSELKHFIKPVEDKLDHSILLEQSDLELIELCKKSNWKYIIFLENPTSEVIAEYIYKEAVKYFSNTYPDIKVDYVDINETCTSSCRYTESDK